MQCGARVELETARRQWQTMAHQELKVLHTYIQPSVFAMLLTGGTVPYTDIPPELFLILKF